MQIQILIPPLPPWVKVGSPHSTALSQRSLSPLSRPDSKANRRRRPSSRVTAKHVEIHRDRGSSSASRFSFVFRKRAPPRPCMHVLTTARSASPQPSLGARRACVAAPRDVRRGCAHARAAWPARGAVGFRPAGRWPARGAVGFRPAGRWPLFPAFKVGRTIPIFHFYTLGNPSRSSNPGPSAPLGPAPAPRPALVGSHR